MEKQFWVKLALSSLEIEQKYRVKDVHPIRIVLRGRAHLRFKGACEKLDLRAGDYRFIPSRTCHRVEWTHPRRKTVWLTVPIKRLRRPPVQGQKG